MDKTDGAGWRTVSNRGPGGFYRRVCRYSYDAEFERFETRLCVRLFAWIIPFWVDY